MASKEENVALIERFLNEVWNEGKESTIDELYHPGGTAAGLGDEYKAGPAQFKLFHQLVQSTCSKIHIWVNEVMADSEKVFFTASMTFTHKATGKPIQLQGAGFAKITEGKINEAVNTWNFLDLLTQLEMVPADVLLTAFMQGTAVTIK